MYCGISSHSKEWKDSQTRRCAIKGEVPWVPLDHLSINGCSIQTTIFKRAWAAADPKWVNSKNSDKFQWYSLITKIICWGLYLLLPIETIFISCGKFGIGNDLLCHHIILPWHNLHLSWKPRGKANLSILCLCVWEMTRYSVKCDCTLPTPDKPYPTLSTHAAKSIQLATKGNYWTEKHVTKIMTQYC